jgi:hypothetical protein
MSKKNTRKQNDESSVATREYYHFTLPQSILNAKKEWLSGNRSISSYEKALAMIVFGQMMRTGASINGWWWGSNTDHQGPPSHPPNQTLFFRTHTASNNPSSYFSPVVEPTTSLRKLELTFKSLS